MNAHWCRATIQQSTMWMPKDMLGCTAQGPLKFYTGFPTYCVRIAPHVTLTLVFLDALKKAQSEIGM